METKRDAAFNRIEGGGGGKWEIAKGCVGFGWCLFDSFIQRSGGSGSNDHRKFVGGGHIARLNRKKRQGGSSLFSSKNDN